ncbi:MAG: histidinol-phosphatase family [Gaiellales bacterium]|jgi:histidinol-phosphatase (PHP family)|nr:histidinol-phosphatase family [Gaiellales bacterium]
MLTDYHMHLVPDGEPYADEVFTIAHVESYVECARGAGIDEIGFTDHVYRFRQARGWSDHPLWLADALADLDRYHACLVGARDADLPVKVGLEVDYLAGREGAIASTVGCLQWDFLLGSVHWVAGLAVDWEMAPIWERYPVDEVWRMYVDDLCAAAASGIYDSMAHPDLAKVFGHRPAPKPLALYEQIADAFAAAAVCAEVSTAGFGRALGELYPDPELLAMLHLRGVPVTLGSDAHLPEHVGQSFDRALAVLREVGYRTITVFDRRDHRQVAFDG